MAQVLSTVFLLKRGLSTAWESRDPILMQGEPGWAIDTKVLKIGDGIKPWTKLEAVTDFQVTEADVEKAVNKYLEEHPIKVTTDPTLTVAGQAADSAAVREQCVFNTDQIIFCAGDADDNIFE